MRENGVHAYIVSSTDLSKWYVPIITKLEPGYPALGRQELSRDL